VSAKDATFLYKKTQRDFRKKQHSFPHLLGDYWWNKFKEKNGYCFNHGRSLTMGDTIMSRPGIMNGNLAHNIAAPDSVTSPVFDLAASFPWAFPPPPGAQRWEGCWLCGGMKLGPTQCLKDGGEAMKNA
jgi:hypothetical protein